MLMGLRQGKSRTAANNCEITKLEQAKLPTAAEVQVQRLREDEKRIRYLEQLAIKFLRPENLGHSHGSQRHIPLELTGEDLH